MLDTVEFVRTRKTEKEISPDGLLYEALNNPVAVTRELNNRSLYHFLQYFWPVISAHTFQPNWHIEFLCTELEKVARKAAAKEPRDYDLVINISPGTSKTILTSIMFPAWCWTQWYWMRFITASYSKDLALESAEYCRDLVRSPEFQRLYPDIGIKEDKDTKSNFKIVKKIPGLNPGYGPKILSGGSRFSTSVGGTLMGFHGDILIVDDPLNPQQAASEVELDNANRWMEQTLPTRKTNKAVTPTILIMQRLHQCLLPDTRVLLKSGFGQIQNTTNNDVVLTSNGWQKIEGVFHKQYKGKVIGFCLSGHPEIFWVTPNHKVYTEKGWVEACTLTKQNIFLFPISKEKETDIVDVQKYWPVLPFEKQVPKIIKSNFVGNEKKVPKEVLAKLIDEGYTSTQMSLYFGFKTRQMIDLYIAKYGLVRQGALTVKNNIVSDSDFWRIVGYWIAEGSLSKGRRGGNYSARFTFGNNDAKLITDTYTILKKYGFHPTVNDTGYNTTNVFCASYQLALFLQQFGVGAKNKNLPEWVVLLPKEYFKELLKGYWLGDGCDIKNNIRITSISLKLLSDIQRGLLRFGVVSSIYSGSKILNSSVIKTGPGEGRIIQKRNTPYEIRIAKRDINNLFYVGEITGDVTKETKNKIKDGWLHVKIRGIFEKDYNGLVYDITTPSHDFLVGLSMLHNSDPAGHLLSKQKANIRHISLPGECRNYKDMVQPPEMVKFYKDDLFDVNRMPWKVLDDMRADLGQYGFSGQIGQNPVPPGGGMFKVDHFQYIDPFNYPKSKIVHTVRYWDKAGTAGGGDYTVGLKMSRLENGFYIVEDVKRGQWGTNEREDVIKQTAIADGTGVHVWIETEPGSSGKESTENTIRNLAGFVVRGEHPTGDKATRADAFSVQVNNGSVYLVTAFWNNAYKEELRFFPFSTHKDQTDASSGAFNHLIGKKIACRVT